jgi:hypothetical protein
MKVPTTTIHSWISQFASVCTFTRLRKKFSQSPDEVLQSRTFSHKQAYKFAFHRLKTNLFCKQQFPSIRRYLWHIADHCPNDLFQRSDGATCSDGNLPDLVLRLVRKDTNAVELAKLGLSSPSIRATAIRQSRASYWRTTRPQSALKFPFISTRVKRLTFNSPVRSPATSTFYRFAETRSGFLITSQTPSVRSVRSTSCICTPERSA